MKRVLPSPPASIEQSHGFEQQRGLISKSYPCLRQLVLAVSAWDPRLAAHFPVHADALCSLHGPPSDIVPIAFLAAILLPARLSSCLGHYCQARDRTVPPETVALRLGQCAGDSKFCNRASAGSKRRFGTAPQSHRRPLLLLQPDLHLLSQSRYDVGKFGLRPWCKRSDDNLCDRMPKGYSLR
jgi:hypothetical protein